MPTLRGARHDDVQVARLHRMDRQDERRREVLRRGG
jgi:hypothetical protein